MVTNDSIGRVGKGLLEKWEPTLQVDRNMCLFPCYTHTHTADTHTNQFSLGLRVPREQCILILKYEV